MRQLHAGVLVGCLATTLLITLALIALAGFAPQPPAADGIVYLSGFLAMALAGCVLAAFRPRNAIAWIFVAGGAGTLLAALLTGLAGGGALGAASSWLSLLALELYGVGWVVVTTLPLLLFPDGRPRGSVARGGVIVAVSLAAVVAVCVAVGAEPDAGSPRSPLAIEQWGAAPRQVLDITLTICAVVSVAAAVLLAVRWRRSVGLERRQLAWLGVAALVMAALFAIGWIVMSVLPGLPDIVGATVEALEIAILPVAMLASILDARLFDIDLVFRRSLVFGVLTVLVGGIYAAAIALASAVVAQGATVVGVLVASVIAAFALAPARDWLARQVESRLYGSRRRHDEAMALVGGRLEDAGVEAGVDATLVAAATALGTGLRLGSVRIELDAQPPVVAEWHAPDAARAASAQDAARAVRNAPVELELRALGALEGRLTATAAAGDTLSDSDVRLLRQLAPQIALVAHAVRTTASLQRSRELIVGAREAERLRLRRDLHDGLGPSLVGLALQAEAVAPLITTDPRRAADLNARVASGLRAVIVDVRAAVDGLRPADLDQLGLAGALAERAQSLAGSGIDVDVRCDADELSPATEVAAYRIATEALANVVRHAQAHSCRVRITREDGVVGVVIEDDGTGFDVGTRSPGVGLESMRARAEEIGGRLTISSTARGTVIEALLPVGAVTPGLEPSIGAP